MHKALRKGKGKSYDSHIIRKGKNINVKKTGDRKGEDYGGFSETFSQ